MKTPQNGKARSVSTERVARHRERKQRGVLCVAGLEIYPNDLAVLRRYGLLPSADPAAVSKAALETALAGLLDRLAQHLGIVGAAPGIAAP